MISTTQRKIHMGRDRWKYVLQLRTAPCIDDTDKMQGRYEIFTFLFTNKDSLTRVGGVPFDRVEIMFDGGSWVATIEAEG